MDIHHIGPEHVSKNITGVISGMTSPDMDIHHIGPEHISKNISRVICGKASPENHLWTWIYITLVRSISPKNISRVISGKTSPDIDIHHIGPEHISENISG